MIHVAYRLLEIIRSAGYCVGWTKTATPNAHPTYLVDAAKYGRRSAAVGNDLYAATVELMQQLDWTLDDS